MNNVATVVKEHLLSEFMEDRTDIELTEDVNLIDEQVIDSLGIFILVDFLQERFDVGIQPEDVTLDNFETIGAISRLVSAKQATGPTS